MVNTWAVILTRPNSSKMYLASRLNHGGLDPLAPEGLRQPVADFSSVGLANLQADAADQGIVQTNGPMHRPALLLGRLGNDRQPLLGSDVRVRIGNGPIKKLPFTWVPILGPAPPDMKLTVDLPDTSNGQAQQKVATDPRCRT